MRLGCGANEVRFLLHRYLQVGGWRARLIQCKYTLKYIQPHRILLLRERPRTRRDERISWSSFEIGEPSTGYRQCCLSARFHPAIEVISARKIRGRDEETFDEFSWTVVETRFYDGGFSDTTRPWRVSPLFI
jgi:hypothetical protein